MKNEQPFGRATARATARVWQTNRGQFWPLASMQKHAVWMGTFVVCTLHVSDLQTEIVLVIIVYAVIPFFIVPFKSKTRWDQLAKMGFKRNLETSRGGIRVFRDRQLVAIVARKEF